MTKEEIDILWNKAIRQSFEDGSLYTRYRFAALVAAASEEKWKQAVIDELVCCHIYNAAHENDPRKALHDAISWNVQVALDPQVSSDAQSLIDRGASVEREACAMRAWSTVLAESDTEMADIVLRSIRARGNT